MTASYRLVQWNRHKRVYDGVLALTIVLFLAVYIGVSSLVYSGEHAISMMILLIRAFAIGALILLHIILCIGPLARLSTLFSPLLYNRRHLGVTMFLMALIHAGLTVLFYGAFGVRLPIAALVDGYQSFNSVSGFPFEILGLAALLILFAMAATSHDFWLAFLSARVWKTLHMFVYLAYAFVILHVVLGAMQSERSPVFALLMIAGMCSVIALHIAAGLRERRRDHDSIEINSSWVEIGHIEDFDLDCGRVIRLQHGERVAVFRHQNGFSAMSNVCAHQGGPLGEGRVVDGCVTCPWHGYQYLPENGQSPPPYHEKIATYELRIEGNALLLNPEARAPGTPITPAKSALQCTESCDG